MNNRYAKLSIAVIVIAVFLMGFVACQGSNKDMDNENDTILIGKVTSIGDHSVSLNILSGDKLVSDKTVLTLDDQTTIDKAVMYDFELGYLITFTITGEVMESYPTQTTAKSILSVEPDDEIVIDLRETVSGLFDGQFPAIIISDIENIENPIVVNKDDFFVIEIDENPSTGYLWTMLENDQIDYVGEGYISDNASADMVGVGGKRYLGVKGSTIGDVVITLELYSPAGIVETTKTITVSVK